MALQLTYTQPPSGSIIDISSFPPQTHIYYDSCTDDVDDDRADV